MPMSHFINILSQLLLLLLFLLLLTFTIHIFLGYKINIDIRWKTCLLSTRIPNIKLLTQSVNSLGIPRTHLFSQWFYLLQRSLFAIKHLMNTTSDLIHRLIIHNSILSFMGQDSRCWIWSNCWLLAWIGPLKGSQH